MRCAPLLTPSAPIGTNHTGNVTHTISRESLLTILLALGFSDGNELREALVLVTGRSTLASTLGREIQLEVRVQVILQCLVTDEPHSTDAAVELDAVECFCL